MKRGQFISITAYRRAQRRTSRRDLDTFDVHLRGPGGSRFIEVYAADRDEALLAAKDAAQPGESPTAAFAASYGDIT